MKAKTTLLLASVFALSSVQVFAAPGFGDLDTPTWRGLSGSTYQHWTFATNNQVAGKGAPYLAEDYTNPYGNPTAQPYYKGTSGAGWSASLTSMNSMTNVWDLGVWNNVTGAKTNGLCTEIIPLPAGQSANAYTLVWLQTLEFKGTSTPYSWWATNMVTGGTQISTNATSSGVAGSTIVGFWTDYRELSRVTGSSVTNNIRGQTTGTALKELIVDTLTIAPAHGNVTIADGHNVSYGAPTGIPASTAGHFTWSQVCAPYDSGSRFPAGTTAQITCTITDQYANTAAYSFWVTNTETSGTAPTVTACSGGSVALSDSCSKLMPDLTAGVTWTAGTPAATLVQTPAAGTVLKAGVYVVSFTATNIIGGAACSTTYTVSGAAPVAPPMALGAVADTTQKLDIAKLGIQAGPDGRSASFFDVFLATSAGGTAVSNNNQIVYTPALHYLGADSMTYRVVDCGGVWNTNTISISVGHAAQSLNMIGVSDNASGGKLIKARGIPTITYHLQQTDSLNGVPAWTTVTDQVTGGTADSQGIIYFTNKAASASSGYYRTTYP